MTDLDQIALDTVEAIANIDPDKLKGGRLQALAQAQCLVRDALQELEEVGAENYTLTQEVDAALEQVIYWRERAVAAEEERAPLAAHVERLHNALGPKILDWIDCGMATNNRHKEAWARELRNELHQALAETPTHSLARLKDERAQAVQRAVKQARLEWAREDKAALARLKAQGKIEALDQLHDRAPGCHDCGWHEQAAELRRQAERTMEMNDNCPWRNRLDELLYQLAETIPNLNEPDYYKNELIDRLNELRRQAEEGE